MIGMIAVKPKPRSLGTRCCAPKFRPSVDAPTALEKAKVFRALGDPVRLRILSMLAKHEGEVCVCDIVSMFDVGQPTISHHLSVLRETGLVGVVRRATWAYYAIDRRAVADVIDFIGTHLKT
jgi:ArsR family transcriptional regulator, arsenate/arsenite/antimonite-responsive transcriptional repressor